VKHGVLQPCVRGQPVPFAVVVRVRVEVVVAEDTGVKAAVGRAEPPLRSERDHPCAPDQRVELHPTLKHAFRARQLRRRALALRQCGQLTCRGTWTRATLGQF
jgi:hypothetical protein